MTGKHRRTKVHLIGIDIFDSKIYEDVFSSTQEVDVPVVSINDYKLVCFVFFFFFFFDTPLLLTTEDYHYYRYSY